MERKEEEVKQRNMRSWAVDVLRALTKMQGEFQEGNIIGFSEPWLQKLL